MRGQCGGDRSKGSHASPPHCTERCEAEAAFALQLTVYSNLNEKVLKCGSFAGACRRAGLSLAALEALLSHLRARPVEFVMMAGESWMSH